MTFCSTNLPNHLTRTMYETATSLSLHRLSRHSLQERYESDEEAVSESDAGAQDLLSSPVGSQEAEIFDYDLTADDTSHMGPGFNRGENTILAPPTIKHPRPVSTHKSQSSATFDEDSYVFDPEEQVVLELPSPDSSPQMASSTFLQPSIYAWPKPPLAANPRSRSVSPASIFSVDEADIQVAKKVTIMEPPTRPTLVLINALGSRSKSSKFRPSTPRSRETSRSRLSPTKPDSRNATLRSPEASRSPRVEKSTPVKQVPTSIPALEDPLPLPSATISRVSEIPSSLYFPAPPGMVPTQEYRNHLPNAESDLPMPRLKMRTRRPTSMRSTSTASVHSYGSCPTTPVFEGTTSLGTMQNDVPAHPKQPCSPVSTPSTPSPFKSAKRSNTGYNVSNILTSRSPLMMRRMARKGSSASIHSLNSLPSDVTHDPSSSQISVATHPVPPASPDPQIPQKSSQRRHLRHNSIAPSGRGFMGIKFGKRSHKASS